MHSPAELPATVSGDCGVLSKSAGQRSSSPTGNALGGADGGREVPDWCALCSPSSCFTGNGERLGGGEHEENHPLKAQDTVTAQSQTVFRKPSSVWKDWLCVVGFLRMEGSAEPQGPGAQTSECEASHGPLLAVFLSALLPALKRLPALEVCPLGALSPSLSQPLASG